MSELRIILMALGGIVVALVVGWEIYRRRSSIRRAQTSARATGPAFDGRSGREPPSLGYLGSVGGEAPRDSIAPTALDVTPCAANDHNHLELGDLNTLASAAQVKYVDESLGGEVGNAKLFPEPGARGASASASGAAAKGPTSSGPELIMVLTLMARDGGHFEGQELQRALAEVDLEHGQMNLYHHFGTPKGADMVPFFSVANAVEPGTFEPGTMHGFTTPGVCFFQRLPGPANGLLAFELMLHTASTLSRILNGELRDSNRGSLTGQGAQQMRDQVVEFCARHDPTRGPDTGLGPH